MRPITGDGRPSERIQFRCDPVLRERAQLAASECEMDLAEWMRQVVEGAVELHFEQGPTEADENEIPDPVEDPEYYLAQLEEDARAAREAESPHRPPVTVHPGLHDPEPATPSPRDCPHHPLWRTGNRCRCGATIGARARAGTTGRFR